MLADRSVTTTGHRAPRLSGPKRELLQTPHHFASGTPDYVTPSSHKGINTDTTRFNSGTTNYVIPASHNQFCQESLPYITAATALLTTIATTFYQLLLL
jgi:hypothetical protein